MTAAAGDKWKKVGIATATTLSSPGYTIGDTSITVASTTNMPTDTGITVAIDVIDSSGERVAGTYNEYECTVASATSLANFAHVTGSGTNRNYSAGATTRVYIPVSANQVNDMVDGLMVEHDQDGTHGAVTTASINNAGALTQTGASDFVGAMTVKSYDGWITETRTWTYASGAGTNVGTFTVADVDLTGVYQVGNRIKLTQTTVKYAIITKVAFSTDTTVTIYMGTDYTIANAAITSPAYSRDKSPVGFPIDPAKWTVTATSSSDRTNFGNGAWATLTDAITVPIGAWRISLKGWVLVTVTQAATRRALVTLSSDASTETNSQTTVGVGILPASATQVSGHASVSSVTNVNLSASTTFTAMGNLSSTTNANATLSGAVTPTVITAVCTYI